MLMISGSVIIKRCAIDIQLFAATWRAVHWVSANHLDTDSAWVFLQQFCDECRRII